MASKLADRADKLATRYARLKERADRPRELVRDWIDHATEGGMDSQPLDVLTDLVMTRLDAIDKQRAELAVSKALRVFAEVHGFNIDRVPFDEAITEIEFMLRRRAGA